MAAQSGKPSLLVRMASMMIFSSFVAFISTLEVSTGAGFGVDFAAIKFLEPAVSKSRRLFYPLILLFYTLNNTATSSPRTFRSFLTLRNIILGATIVLLLATPLLNEAEITALVSGVAVRQNNMSTPAWIKAIKDVGLLVMCAAAGWATLRQMDPAQKRTLWAYGLVTLAAAASAIYTLIANPIGLDDRVFLVMAGARWFLPVVLAWLLIGKIDAAFMRVVARVAAVLFLVSFAFQLFLAFHATNGYGFNQFGLPERVSGVFLVANTAGFYACIAAFLAYYYLEGSPLRWPVLILAPVSIFFTQSGGAIMGLALLLWLVPMGRRWLRARLILLPILGVGMLLSLQFLTARSDLLRVSGQGRLRIFTQAVTASGFISNQFGKGTNSGVMLRSVGVDTQSQITDSFYASVVTNTGAFGLFAVMAFLTVAFFICLRFAWKTGRIEPLAFWGLYASFGATTSFTEAFPMNLLMAVWIGAFTPALLALQPEPEKPPISRNTLKLEWGALAVFAALAIILGTSPALYAIRLLGVKTELLNMTPQTDPAVFQARATQVESNLKDIATLQPDRPNASIMTIELAGKYGQRGDWVGAIQVMARVRTDAPRDYQTMQAARDIYNQLSDLVVKQPELLAAFRQHSFGFQDYVELGHYAMANGQYRAAATWYELAQEIGPDRPDVGRDMWQRLGVAYMLSLEYNKAMAAFTQAKDQPPGGPVNWKSGRYYPSNPFYQGYVDLLTGAGCLENRADRTADVLGRDPKYILRMAELAWFQGRWQDATMCYALQELSETNKPKTPATPELLMRKASAAALAGKPDAAARAALVHTVAIQPAAPTQLSNADFTNMLPAEQWPIFQTTFLSDALAKRAAPFAHSPLLVALVDVAQPGAYRITAQLAPGQSALNMAVLVDEAAPAETPITRTLTAGYHQIVVLFDQPASQPAPALGALIVEPAP